MPNLYAPHTFEGRNHPRHAGLSCEDWEFEMEDEEPGEEPNELTDRPEMVCKRSYPHKPHQQMVGGKRFWCTGRDQRVEEPEGAAAPVLRIETYGDLPPKAQRILAVGGPAQMALVRYADRAKDYADQDGFDHADALGIPGQFAEIWRKIGKLKNAMWDGRELVGEQPVEILEDLIGHCLLAIDAYREREGKDGQVGTAPGPVR